MIASEDLFYRFQQLSDIPTRIILTQTYFGRRAGDLRNYSQPDVYSNAAFDDPRPSLSFL